MDDKVLIYTDGACSQNGTWSGGYGAVLKYKENTKEIYGGEKQTTNNRMELLACIKSLEEIKTTKIPIEIYADSAYVVNCFDKKWYVGWRKNGWKNSKKQPVENRDLWERLLDLVEKQKSVTFLKVKGHADNEFNIRADELAVQGRVEIDNE